MAKMMKAGMHLSRPMSSMKLEEMEGLAVCAFHVWICELSHRVAVEPDIEMRERMRAMLL